MAKNPRWWKDVNDGSAQNDEPEAELPGEGEPVSEDLTHEQLDAVAKDRGIDVPPGLNKADKVAYINDPDNQVV